jgi:hypothetical protein
MAQECLHLGLGDLPSSPSAATVKGGGDILESGRFNGRTDNGNITNSERK